MAEPITPTSIEALIEGGISGQVAVGNYNVQIHADHGAVVHLLPPDRQPKPRLRPGPVLLRPRPFHGLVDRQSDVSAATAALRDGLPVELDGPPGVGKSTLLRHLAYDLQVSSLPDGVVHLSARGQPPADLLQSLFDAFCECDTPFKPTDAQARHFLQGRRALVLLDDVELSREEIESLLDAASGCAFILTAQEQRLWGEVRAVALGGLPAEDALTLFERELGRPLTDEERQAALDLCSALECHPLRVLQAAALAREGKRSLAELAREARSAPGPEAVERHALGTLSAAERRIVAILAAAEGAPVGIEILKELAGPEAERVLARLLERKLVQAHSPRYSLTIALDDATRRALQVESWQERLSYGLTRWAEEHRSDPERLLEESGVLRQALESLAKTGSWEGVRRLGRSLDTALTVTGRWGAWGQVTERVLDAAKELQDETGRAWALHQRGTRSLCLSDRERAREDLIQALEIRERLGDFAGATVTRHNLGILLGPPPTPESPAKPVPRRRFPRLLAWTAVPILLGLLTLGGLMVFSERPDPHSPVDNGSVSPTPSLPIDEDTVTTDIPISPDPTPIVPPVSIRVTPGELDFGEQRVGRPGSARKAVVTRSGGDSLWLGTFRLSGADADHFVLAPGSCAGRTLEAGRECAIEVTFTPRQPRPYSARLEIRDETGRIFAVMGLLGVGTAPGMDVDPDRVSFGTIQAGSAEPQRISVVNTGTAPLEVETGFAENPDGAFAVRSSCQGSLQLGKKCLADVSFLAKAPGEYRATLEIRDMDGGIEPRRVEISGTVRGHPAMEISPARLEFGSVEAGVRSRPQEVRISSTGNAPLPVESVALVENPDGAFDLRSDCAGAVLPPGKRCHANIYFVPRKSGQYRAILEVHSAEETIKPGRVAIFGTATEPRRPAMDVSPTRLAFGSVETGTKVDPQEFEISSTGNAPLPVESVTWVVNPDRAFALESSCAGTLIETGKPCYSKVSFLPRKPGEYRATLEVRSSDKTVKSETIALFGSVKEQIVDDRGWCCVEGVLSEADESDCRGRGSFFKNQSVANAMCAATRPGCCLDGDFREGVSAQECDRKGGTPMKPLEAAVRCRKLDPKGWCCLGKRIVESTQSKCDDQKGAFFSSRAVADQKCAPEPPPAGRCCVRGELLKEEITQEKCEEGLKGKYLTSRDPELQCRQLAPGWCCSRKGVERITKDECTERKGDFFSTKEEADKDCGSI